MTPTVVYVVPDKLGGVFNYVNNLLTYRLPDGFRYTAVRTDNERDPDTRADEPLPADEEAYCHFSLPPENLYAVLKRLARLIPRGPGVLVAQDWLPLAMSAAYDTGRTLINITHGDFDYYYDLAVMHEPIIDCFLTYTRRMEDRLRQALPHRVQSIARIPYGVPVPSSTRRPVPGPLRLLYVGRLSRHKGVFDLPLIDAELVRRGVPVTWTIQGAGPDADELVASWTRSLRVRWTGKQPMSEVLELYQEHDVLIMPSRNEGLPVALLEAGAAGVVPVVSDLPSGIPEVVEPGENGYTINVGHTSGFVEAVAELQSDRELLERMSRAIRHRVSSEFDARVRAAEYQALYARFRDLRRPRPTVVPLHYGSRLDQPWIPNSLVRAIRSRTPVSH